MDTWLKKAYENWNQVVEYDGKSLLNFMEIKKPSTSKSDLPLGSVEYSLSLDNQLPTQRLPAPVPSEPASMDQSIMVGGEHHFIENILLLLPFSYIILL